MRTKHRIESVLYHVLISRFRVHYDISGIMDDQRCI